jgi:hypothetical protein
VTRTVAAETSTTKPAKSSDTKAKVSCH